MFHRRRPNPRASTATFPCSGVTTPRTAGEDAGGERYPAWLRSAGVDPETGRMTDAGIELYYRLLREQATKRGSRRDPRHFKERIQDLR